MKILIVEDARLMALVLQRHLQRMGYSDIHMVESAEEAHAFLTRHKQQVGILFVDWSLPGMSGLELVKNLRAQEAFRHLPIIMVTGHTERSQVVEALQAGVSEYLIKPLQYDTLNEKVSQMLGFNVREAGPDDAEAIMGLILELATYTKMAHEAHPDVRALRRHLAADASPRCEAVLAEHKASDQIAGFALFYASYSTFLTRWGLYLEDLYVKPAFRGRGAGFALLQRVAQIAVERECERLEFSVLSWNTSAIDFYNKLDAELLNDWRVMRLSGEALQTLGE